MGPSGLREVARQSHAKAAYAANAVAGLEGFRILTPRPFYDKFLVNTPLGTAELRHRLVERHILAGVPLFTGVEGFETSLLLAFTERNTRAEIDALVQALADVAR
jgi:glycine dehydrogenase subunit 1